MKPSAKVTPKVFMEMPSSSISGFMAVAVSASRFSRALYGRRMCFCDNLAMADNRRSFGKDNGLQARMALTLFLLGLLYVVFVGVLFAAGAGAGLIVVVAVVLLLGQLFGSDKLAMAAMGLKEVTPE